MRIPKAWEEAWALRKMSTVVWRQCSAADLEVRQVATTFVASSKQYSVRTSCVTISSLTYMRRGTPFQGDLGRRHPRGAERRFSSTGLSIAAVAAAGYGTRARNPLMWR